MNIPEETASGIPASPAEGRIITFYSYKGGTGRSMALANVAWMLAMNNKQVLVIDWDLEAPGVHRYFHPFIEDKELQSTRGLMDFVEDLAARAAASPEPLADKEGDVSPYVINLDRDGWNWEEFGDRAGIDLIPAGQQNAGYSKKLNSFDWISFYTKLGGRRLLSYMISQLKTIYDYILIDSRTGVSDTSGICTVEMPDTVVVCFTLNDQSIRGAANVSESIASQHKLLEELRKSEPAIADPGAREFRIYPIPTRIDNTENDKRQIGISLARKTFSRYLGDVSQDDLSKYWGDFQMPYIPNYAFEEIPAVFGDLPYDQLSICAFIGRLTKELTGEKALRPAFLPEDRRLEAVKWFQRQSETPQDPVQLAEEAFRRLPDELKRQAIQVLLRLVGFTHRGSSSQGVSVEELQRGLSEAADALIKARILRSVLGQGGQVLLLSEPTLCEAWPRYAEWIQNDLEFLQWRQSINSAAQAWRLTKSSESSLLRGDSLEDAKVFWRTRANDLNEDERDYISTSIERDDQRRSIDELNRFNQEALERQLASVKSELASTSKALTKRPWYSSKKLLFAGLSALAATLAIGWYFIQKHESEVQQSQALQAQQAQAVQAQLTQALQTQQTEIERLVAEVATEAEQAELARQKQSSNNSSNSKPPASASGSSAQSLNCHILPTTFPWTLPGQIAVKVNGNSAGLFTIGPKGSSGLEFACRSGENSVQMYESGYQGTCALDIVAESNLSLNFTPGFNLYNNGTPPTCSLVPAQSTSPK